MKNKKEYDKSTHFSSANSSMEENPEMYYKSRPRGGIKSKVNSFQPISLRHTVAVPLNTFSGVSHNASFQSKLLFFNAGKPRPKFQYIPMAHDKVITEEKESNNKKLYQKRKIEKIDIDNNININKILDSKNNNYNSNYNNYMNNKINNNENTFSKKTVYKKRCLNTTYNQISSLNLDMDTSINNEKKQAPLNIKLKSLKDQWYYQKILLDYNILDFTSKYII